MGLVFLVQFLEETVKVLECTISYPVHTFLVAEHSVYVVYHTIVHVLEL